MGKVVDEIMTIAEPIIKSLNLELVDIEYVKEGNEWVLRIFIENTSGEVSLDNCEDVSKKLSERLDQKDPIKQNYILEVSSPGIERPLKKLKDYDRFIGNMVIVKTYVPLDGQKEFLGILLKREEKLIRIKKKSDESEIKISFDNIAKAHLTYDFGT